jgi:hypothetical protein
MLISHRRRICDAARHGRRRARRSQRYSSSDLELLHSGPCIGARLNEHSRAREEGVDYNVKIRIKSDGSAVELANVEMSMNPFDEIAVEEALRQEEASKAPAWRAAGRDRRERIRQRRPDDRSGGPAALR